MAGWSELSKVKTSWEVFEMTDDRTRKENLKSEIIHNLLQIKTRAFQILPRLLARYLFTRGVRTQTLSLSTYDKYWDSFWMNKDIFRTNLPFTIFDKRVEGISPFESRQRGIIAILAEIIRKYDIRSVLEVGSGGGLNLLLLAPTFPNVSFIGLEPTESGVRVSNEFIKSPPPEFEEAFTKRPLLNVEIIRGTILEPESIIRLRDCDFDLVYTVAVLEQLHNHVDVALNNIFNLTGRFFLFYEEWLEANYIIGNYLTLVDSDYFRLTWNYLNMYKGIEILERFIPAIQPSWLKYGVVFGKKLK